MTWEYEYDPTANETTIRWRGNDEIIEDTIPGKIDKFYNGYPTGDARETIADMMQSAGTPNRILMQFDFNYGFDNVTDFEQS